MTADPRQRRALLASRDNPRRTLDLLVEQRLEAGGCALAVRYVPDQAVLDAAGCADYLAALAGLGWPELPAVVFEDINSELVPRWLALRAVSGGDVVVLQDARPNWSKPALLACLQAW